MEFLLVCVLIALTLSVWAFAPLLSASGGQSARLFRFAGGVGLATLAVLAVYLIAGRPDLPGKPATDRLEALKALDPELLSLATRRVILESQIRSGEASVADWMTLAQIRLDQGDALQAAIAFERAMTLDATSPAPAIGLALALMQANGDTPSPEAAQAFAEALRRDKDNNRAHFGRALILTDLGEHEKARPHWAETFATAPSNAVRDAQADLAIEALSQPRVTQDAVEALAEEVLDPDARIDAMIAGLERRLSADEGDVQSWLILMRAYHRRGDAASLEATLAEARDALVQDAMAGPLLEAVERNWLSEFTAQP